MQKIVLVNGRLKRRQFKMNKKRVTVLLAGALALIFLTWSCVSTTAAKDKDEKEVDRIHNAATVLKEILDIPDDIPQDLLDKARCVMVFPSVVKAAFVVGGSYGRGVMVCRSGKDFSGPWGAPTMMALEGGSFGLQIGGQATDFVILVMNGRGAESLLHNKVKLGADASIAAGPKGRDAQAATDVTFRAEMLSYSRARGVFAGVSLEGSTVHPDNEANRRLYGRDVNPEQIIMESKVEAPPVARELIAVLQKATPHVKS
jgi:SH3 domain-containing YSC84-like protein 1